MIRRLSTGAGLIVLALAAAIAQITPAGASGPLETTSLLGRKLFALRDTDGAIAAARKNLEADPKNASLVLKLSKAQAAKRQYKEAIATCTMGLKVAPKNADLYLERGHRELGLREFKAGEADLERAVELDPKQLDAQYHLGMAHYFLRQFEPAAQGFRHSLDLAHSPDSVIDCSNWLYVALRRGGQAEAAANVLKRITPDVKNEQPHLYFYLRLLHFYQGGLSEAELMPPAPSGPADIEGELSYNTVNYGVGNWHLYNGHAAEARPYFERVVKGYAWNSWGFVGSELELANGRKSAMLK